MSAWWPPSPATPVPVDEVDAREAGLRSGPQAAALPASRHQRGPAAAPLADPADRDRTGGRRRGRGTRRHRDRDAPTEAELLPDATARLEIGSIAAAALADPLARALFADVTAAVEVSRRRGRPTTTPATRCGSPRRARPARLARPAVAGPPLGEVRSAITEHLRGAARRRAFRVWLDERRAALVRLAPGYEHPGDPRQPDNTHRH